MLDSIITAFGIFLILPFKSIHQNNTPAMIELAINLVFYLIIIFINSKDIILIFKLLLFSSCMIFIVKLFYSIKLYKNMQIKVQEFLPDYFFKSEKSILFLYFYNIYFSIFYIFI